jgi:16S rRNA (cytosine1402-N4)-methyltransferase
VRLINKKVITPSKNEIDVNPRSRSAKLRAAERIIVHGESNIITEDDSFITTAKTRGWRRPALIEKIRLAFLAA